jgi:formylglycine-generating enzyme required for sulfatase activity
MDEEHWLKQGFRVLMLVAVCVGWTEAETHQTRVNSLGMSLVRVEAGSFRMGSEDGDFDEKPLHEVSITQPFFMAATPVTNMQYEQFAPAHAKFRGNRGLSREDDEAVIFISWVEAADFCDWLSAKEGLPYRLPTEAEWEYACRAGTVTEYATGNELPSVYHREQADHWEPEPVSLKVGQTPPNGWGLMDMHGLVEEWCLDWYGPYPATEQTDPIGYEGGISKVTRGGSHGVEAHYLRSANRLGALPDDRLWLTGFRVIIAPVPPSRPLPVKAEIWARNVSQEVYDWSTTALESKALFLDPIPFVRIPANTEGPLFSRHNHCPDITFMANGDLLATWYTTREEKGRELAVAAARLRKGQAAWDNAALFHKVPDRNMHATALWTDAERNILYHFQGISASYGWANLALFYRTSTDNGATWSAHHWIAGERGLRNMPIAGAFKTRAGALILPCDAVTGMDGGSTIHISLDDGKSWKEASKDKTLPTFQEGATGGSIAGIHAGVVELNDGRLLAFGRGDAINGHMPRSVSGDLGRTWDYAGSSFPPIGGGQRLVLMRLRKGPILFVSFTDPQGDNLKGLLFSDASNKPFIGYGMFAALSYDDGETWPVQKLLTPGKGEFSAGGNTGPFTATPTRAEPGGYLAATQTPDHMIHLVSSSLHYRFTLKWIETPCAPVN